MYTYICIYIYIYIYVYLCVCVRVFVFVCVCVFMCPRAQSHVSSQTCCGAARELNRARITTASTPDAEADAARVVRVHTSHSRCLPVWSTYLIVCSLSQRCFGVRCDCAVRVGERARKRERKREGKRERVGERGRERVSERESKRE